jgi:hypothetical protein
MIKDKEEKMNNVFVKTKNVKAFVALAKRLETAKCNAPKMGLIFGEPGLGKSNAVLWWSLNQDAILITAKNGMSRKWLLSDIVRELGEAPFWTTEDLFNQAVSKIVEKPRMIIVDEVDYLTKNSQAIETIRDLHDKTGVPVLLVGMGCVDKKLSKYKHLFDRIVEIYRFTPFDMDDVKEIVTSLCEVKIADETVKTLQKKSNRFRQLVKNITTFENLAHTNGCKSITNEELGW